MAVLLDSMSRSSAPACCCQEWCFLERCLWHHCAHGPTQPARQAELQQKWAATLVVELHVGRPVIVWVHWYADACHFLLQAGHFHSTLELLPAITCSGTFSFLLWVQYRAASGAMVASELCKQTRLLLHYGDCLPRVLPATRAVQMCGSPAGHLPHCHKTLRLLCGLNLIAPWCMFLSTLHFYTEHADVWRPWKSVMLLGWLDCCCLTLQLPCKT